MRKRIAGPIPLRLSPHGTAKLCALAALLAVPHLTPAAEAELVRRQFREVDTLFANPGQGWMSQQRSPRGEPRFPCSVVPVAPMVL